MSLPVLEGVALSHFRIISELDPCNDHTVFPDRTPCSRRPHTNPPKQRGYDEETVFPERLHM
jgi:hypothetical protein